MYIPIVIYLFIWKIGEKKIKDPTDCFRGQLQDKFTCCKCGEVTCPNG